MSMKRTRQGTRYSPYQENENGAIHTQECKRCYMTEADCKKVKCSICHVNVCSWRGGIAEHLQQRHTPCERCTRRDCEKIKCNICSVDVCPRNKGIAVHLNVVHPRRACCGRRDCAEGICGRCDVEFACKTKHRCVMYQENGAAEHVARKKRTWIISKCVQHVGTKMTREEIKDCARCKYYVI
jgi:hypothetical protein